MKIEPHLETLLPQLELRVLHGPQAGSRLTLFVGEYTLGTDDECEVMLAGPRLMGMHARLKIDADIASISPVDGNVLDAHGKQILGDTPLAIGMPVEIGGVWISIDEVDAPWPTTETLIPQPSAGPLPDPTESSEPSLMSEAEARGESDFSAQRTRAKRLLIISMTGLASVAVLGVAGAFWLSSQPMSPTNESVASAAPMPSAPTLSDRLAEAFPGRLVQVTSGHGGATIVTAYAADGGMVSRMQQMIRKIDGTAITHFFADDAMLESASSVVLKYRREGTRAVVKVTGMNNGTASLRGVVASQSVRDELSENLRNSVPGLRGIELTAQGADELPSLLTDRLTVADLSKKLQVVSRQPEFTLRGNLSEDEIQRWEAVLTQFSEEFGQILPIRAMISIQQKRPPINVQTVVGGSMPFVMTDTGQRIGVGGETNGHTISAIRDDEIVFDGTLRFRIPR
ncbi:MAG: EscD/YscD/HrpQ family type III secretion system inner membrane ring protein [Oxalobacteraceae bacterium]|nr:EscD/YscD/HrpQ family type III secretion system inner membrane ring protein [Oxalobacteraceae bacterium]